MSILNETTLPLTEAPEWLPKKQGKPLSFSTVFRWALRGIVVGDRRVRLEAIKLGGRLITSKEAIERFAAALTGQAEEDSAGIRTPVARKVAAAKVKRKLAAIGI